mgnify:CR=1 FL=1
MQHTYEMHNAFHAVALRDFDKDGDGELNETEMTVMQETYDLWELEAEEFSKLPENVRETVHDMRGAHVLDVNVKRQQERRDTLAL